VRDPATARFKAVLRDAVIIAADNVCEYMYAGTDKEEFILSEDFPNAAPPFALFFMESRRPSAIRSNDPRNVTRDVTTMPHRTGVLFEGRRQSAARAEADTLTPQEIETRTSAALDGIRAGMSPGVRELIDRIVRLGDAPPDPDVITRLRALPDAERTVAMMYLTMLDAQLDARRTGKISLLDGDPKDDGWELSANPIMEYSGTIVRFPVHHSLILDSTGRIRFSTVLCEKIQGLDPSQELIASVQQTQVLLYPFLLAISFMHCKNVQVVDNPPPPKLSAKHARRHGAPLLSFKTLVIEPMQHVLREAAGPSGASLQAALHICRGHFKDYRAHGLFGRHKEVFWWESQVRGKGPAAVTKDYNLALPRRDR
jgi:hypothetical protein